METGIYRIIAPSGKCYVGLTMDSFSNRFRGHCKDLKAQRHKCTGLQRAYNKYGEKALVFEVLERLDSSENLMQREQYWWDHFFIRGVSLYNGRPTGTGSVFHTEITKRKISLTIAKKLSDKYPDRIIIRNKEGQAQFLFTCLCCGKNCAGGAKRKYCSKQCSGKSLGPGNRGYRKVDEDKAKELFTNNVPILEIANIMGCSKNTVSRAIFGR